MPTTMATTTPAAARWIAWSTPAPLPDALLDDLQQQDRLHRALALLDERSRALLTLLFLQDEPVSYSDIAQRLQMPEGSIGPTRARCLQRLRALLDNL